MTKQAPTKAGVRTLRIGELADRAGLSADTIRYYERQGLLRPARTPGGARRYGEEAVVRLAFVRMAVGLGFSLAEVREFLRLRVSSRTPCESVRAQAQAKLASVQARIADLERVRRALERVVATCTSASASACPFLEALETA